MEISKRKLKRYLIVVVSLIAFAFLISILPEASIEQNYQSKEKVSPAKDYSLESYIDEEVIELEINKGVYEFVEGQKTEVYSYNGQIPGPIIYGNVGEEQKVVVKNNLDVPTTVHWHGLQLANVQDGVPQVTQDPIEPGESFEYVLEFRNPGLYWYHSHVDAHEQVESGLQGVILVSDEGESVSDAGEIIVLDDVLLGEDYQFRSFDLGVMHGRYGNVLLVNWQKNPTINLENNRLRLVNTANARSFSIGFSGETFSVIGMDIDSSERFETDSLVIHPGERYDILLSEDSPRTFNLNYNTRRGSTNLAELVYEGGSLNILESEMEIPFNLEELIEKKPDKEVYLQGFRGGHMGIIWSINGKYYPENTEIFSFNEGEVVKMRLINTQGQPHPMHLHGQKFIVLSRDGVPEQNLGWKDTVMVGSFEEVDIAFVAEEKGEWVFHCHILEHAEAGMLSVVKVE